MRLSFKTQPGFSETQPPLTNSTPSPKHGPPHPSLSPLPSLRSPLSVSSSSLWSAPNEGIPSVSSSTSACLSPLGSLWSAPKILHHLGCFCILLTRTLSTLPFPCVSQPYQIANPCRQGHVSVLLVILTILDTTVFIQSIPNLFCKSMSKFRTHTHTQITVKRSELESRFLSRANFHSGSTNICCGALGSSAVSSLSVPQGGGDDLEHLPSNPGDAVNEIMCIKVLKGT